MYILTVRLNVLALTSGIVLSAYLSSPPAKDPKLHQGFLIFYHLSYTYKKVGRGSFPLFSWYFVVTVYAFAVDDHHGTFRASYNIGQIITLRLASSIQRQHGLYQMCLRWMY